jgi:membrane dipeptidase
VGVTLYREFVGGVPEGEQFPGFVPGSCDEVVAHWLHLARAIGPEALALGSDFNGFVARPRPGGRCPEGIRGSWDLPELFAALQEKGVPREALDASGERLLSAWATAERGADADLRHAALRARPSPRGQTNLP